MWIDVKKKTKYSSSAAMHSTTVRVAVTVAIGASFLFVGAPAISNRFLVFYHIFSNISELMT
jgi:hypothetical protein